MKRSALITGGARRIGRQLALDLAAQGWAVALHYNTSGEQADALVKEIEAGGGSAVSVQADLSDGASLQGVVDAANSGLGELTCLVNNASRFEHDSARSMALESWDAHLDTNLRAPVFLSQAFSNQLADGHQGNIINIVDQRVWKLNPNFFSYTTSKAALWTVTKTLAQALAPNIRVNAIGPGPALPNARMNDDDFALQSSLTLLERGTSPEEISDAVKFILSAPALTGQMIVLDGGQHLLWKTPDIAKVNE